MADLFDEISFLTRSENRVEVLGTLSEGAYTERELVDETGISKVTVGRIMEDFLDRGWVRETEEGYEATRFGDLLAEDYARISKIMSEVTKKREAIFERLDGSDGEDASTPSKDRGGLSRTSRRVRW